MNRKIIYLAALVLMSIVNVQAQEWTKLLPQNKAELTLQDYKQAFDSYWKPFNVTNKGYYLKNGVKKKAYGWKQFNRWYHNMEGQVDAQGHFPKQTAQQVYNAYKQQNRNMSSNTETANWVNLGPSSSTGGYAGVGRISAIAFHPTDMNTYWVGAPAGGLWKTTDNGSTWTCLTDNNNVLGISDIVIPSDYATSHTIYIATGDRDTWDNRSIGVLKSTDGGTTWNTTALQYNLGDARKINRLLLDPNNDQTIIAATNDGVYKTTNGGTTWNTQLSWYSFIDMEYKPGDFSTLYGSTMDGKIYRSTNSGSTWTLSQDEGQRVELAVSPAMNNLVVAVSSNATNGLQGVYRSTNSGASFETILLGTTKNLLDWYAAANGNEGQGWYDLSLAVSPTNANIIFVGGINTWKTQNNGTSWELSNHWYGDGGIQAVHADKHILKYRSNGDLFEGNDGGIYISSNNGTSWTDKTNGMVISQMYKLGTSAQFSSEIITGLQDNGTKLLKNSTWYDVKGGDGMECLIDYTDHNIQYGSYTYGQISRTTDAWGNSTNIQPTSGGEAVKGAWVTPYVISPSDHNTLYAGYANVWKTTNKGDTWTEISSMNSSEKLRSLAVAPSNTSYIYAADRSNIWKTSNGGTSWTSITSGLPTSYSNISYITVKHDDPNHLWVTITGYNNHGVYESTNGGSTWANISAGLPQIPVYTLVEDTQSTVHRYLYVGTELGVFYKKGTENWAEYNDGLPKVKCGELEIYYDQANSSNSRLRLASYGRGLWETPLINKNIVVQTTVPHDITVNSAVSGGNLIASNSSAITARGIVWSTNANPTLSDNVVADSETGTGTFSANITGLSASTTYHVRAYATTADETLYGEDESFITPCEAVNTFPFTEGFEGEAFPPQCWVSFRGSNNLGTDQDWKHTTTAHTGDKAAYIQYENVSGGDAEDWLVSPPLNMPTVSANLSFFERQEWGNNYGTQYAVKISTTSQTDISSFTNLITYTEDNLSSSTYTERNIDLSAYVGQLVYIAFVMTNDDGDNWYVDDINVTGTSAAPVAAFSANPLAVCAGGTVNFTDTSSNVPNTWAWNFGDGTVVSNEQNPTHTYTSSGTYTVSLTAGNATGENTVTKNNYITVTAAPNAGTNGTLSLCEGVIPTNEQLLAALGGTPDVGGTWTNTDLIYTYTVNGTAPCEDATATVVITPYSNNAGEDATLTVCVGTTPTDDELFAALGGTPDTGGVWTNVDLVYTYTVTGTCESSPASTATITVIEQAMPNAGENGTLTICAGTTPSDDELFAALEGTPDTGGTWTHSGLVYTYTVDVVAPCTGASVTSTVTLTEQEAPNAGENGTLTVCLGTTPTNDELFAALEGTPSTGGTWTNVDLVYTYTVVGTAPCDNATATVTLIEQSLPNAGVNSTLTICEGTTPTNDELFAALGGSPNTGGTWTHAGLVYTYTVNATAPCSGTASSTVTLSITPLPTASFTIDASNEPLIELNNTSSEATSYAWDLGDGNHFISTHVSHEYTSNGTYTIKLDATNSCGTVSHEKSITITNVGIASLEKENIKIFPNPSETLVNIVLPIANANIRLISMDGKVLRSIKAGDKQTIQLDVKDLSTGVYNLEISSEKKGKTVVKLIKK